MASRSKYLDEENVLDILNESDECLINDSSDDNDGSDDFEDDIAVAVADANAVEEQSLGDVDYSSSFIL
jgi:hypothetical protein